MLRPLFEKKTISKVYSELDNLIYWFIIVRDVQDNGDRIPERELLLHHVAKKINSYLWTKKSADNYNFLKGVNLIMELLSIRYLKEDSLSYSGLAPLLNHLKGDNPFKECIHNWLASQERPAKGLVHSEKVSRKIEQIFRNSQNSGSIVFCFKIIDNFSRHLEQLKDF